MTRTVHTSLNAFEVLEIARRVEKNGAIFYRKAAARACSQDSRQMLLDMASTEERHEKAFAEMTEQLQYEERRVTLFESLADIAKYICELADSKVFNPQDDLIGQLTGKETPNDILKIAIDKEKDLVVFYVGLKDFVPVDAGKSTIDVIIKEKTEYLNVLENERERVALDTVRGLPEPADVVKEKLLCLAQYERS